uniref:AlNc14C283G10146 protein n=1 Tax=Albugo laibachii Nc14 TaxID=890382 RepID=F0WV00_9STRA|nr:AlNc14C283G10146 [Albugo laibachii Nc14]|eukprot:CCA25236.1 AlNc14C283G10146 [Albugo laibachii Nc14]
MKKDSEDVTEQDWITYFRGAEEPDYVDLAKIDAEMRRIKLDMTLMDAGSMISRLRNQVYRILYKHGLQEYVEQGDSKRIVKWLVGALEPPAFKRKNVEKLEMNMHKMKKRNPVVFCKWRQDLL